MNRISYYLVLIILIGSGLASFWAYKNYFQKEKPNWLLFQVKKENIQEIVKVRGKIVPQKEFNLKFPFLGIVKEVNVKAGDQVKAGEKLAKLDSTPFYYESQKAQALFEGDLEKATISYQAAKENLNKTISANQGKLDQASTRESDAEKYLDATQKYFNGVDSNFDAGDAAYDQAKQTLVAAENAYREAQDAYSLVKKLTAELEAVARQTLKSAEASLNQKNKQFSEKTLSYNNANYQLSLDSLAKTTLKAPMDGVITDVKIKTGELTGPTQTAILMATGGVEIQAEISELDIDKLHTGNKVEIRLDAFPDQKLEGSVVFIEPKEIVKEGDTYYRARVNIKSQKAVIRSGMKADLVIHISSKKNVLTIPEFTIYQKNNQKFVKVLRGDSQQEVAIKTGISNSESIEVTKGLQEGDTVVASAD